MEVKGHLPLVELERLERGETNAQRAKRLRIVILATRGFTALAIAMCVGLSRRICQRWGTSLQRRVVSGIKRSSRPATSSPADGGRLATRRPEPRTDEVRLCTSDFKRAGAE